MLKGSENVKDDFFIAQGKGIKGMGESEDVMKIAHGKKFCFSVLKPLSFCQRLTLWAMTVTA